MSSQSELTHTINGRPPVVLKFGGTSVKDAEAMRRVVAITERERSKMPVVVTSACAGVTSQLLECAELAGQAKPEEALAIVAELRTRHLEILDDLCSDAQEFSCKEELVVLLDGLEQLVRGVILLGELTPRTVDTFASHGERLSSRLLTTAFRVHGWNAGLADSTKFIITDDNFGNAIPLMDEIDRKADDELAPLLSNHEVIIAQGFVGSTREGITTTIGRGGSDHSAALVGAALRADEIQIWTDVSGILTADPRAVSGAKVVPEVTFTEARELAYFGAKVLHPDTIIPAVSRDIPVVIRNSMQPEDPGTRILPDDAPIDAGIHSLTVLRDMLLLQLSEKRHTVPGSQAPIEDALQCFQKHGATIHAAVFAESRTTVVIHEKDLDDVLQTKLESHYLVDITRDSALLCLIGAHIRRTPALLSRPLAALGTISIQMIVTGSSDHLVLLGIPNSDATTALIEVHRVLFE